nr:MAG TPA: hypothetical protein [Caudoviricetes sp.]
MAAPEGYNALGKIGISYKGDYDSNTTYERLDAVEHNGSTYLAIKDAPDGAPRDDKVNWIYLAKGFSGDIGDSEITFTEAENRENINTGESVKTVFGKIKKFFADLTAPAFAQMITSKDDLLATKATGYVPDAKAVADAVTDVTGKLDTKLDTSSYVKSSNGSLLGLVKNNEVWLIIFNRISTLDTCVCVASRYADVVSVFTVSKSATMSINYNNQGTITVAYNGSTDGVFGGAFKFYG